MPNANALNAFLLLDRSGSMGSRWGEALGAVNAYVKAIGEADVTLATFDGMDGLKFEVIRDRTAATAWKDVTTAEAEPRGMTPLYDAFARIVALADAAACEKTVVIVMTDGAENASREVARKDAAALVARCKEKGWQVVFLGADFDAFAEADLMGVPRTGTLNVTRGNYTIALKRIAHRSRRFADTEEAPPIEFDDEDRGAARGE